MDSRPVSAEYLTAGQEYLDALVRLELVPNFLGWGWDFAVQQWNLVLVTSILDAGGPLGLNRLLFQAYNAGATPKKISPFIVRIFSPAIIPQDFWVLGQKNLSVTKVQDRLDWQPVKIENAQKIFMGLQLEMRNSYQTLLPQPQKARKFHDRRRDWERFRSNIEKLAA